MGRSTAWTLSFVCLSLCLVAFHGQVVSLVLWGLELSYIVVSWCIGWGEGGRDLKKVTMASFWNVMAM